MILPRTERYPTHDVFDMNVGMFLFGRVRAWVQPILNSPENTCVRRAD